MSKLGIETKQLSLNQNMSMLNSYQYTSFSLSFKNLNKNIFPSGPVPITITVTTGFRLKWTLID